MLTKIVLRCLLFGLPVYVAILFVPSSIAEQDNQDVENLVVEHTLENGLRVIVQPDERAPVAAVMLWYRAGSMDEVGGKTGVAHVLEHLMFQGTKNVGPGEYAKIVAEVGGRTNAFTSSDYTGYFQELHNSHLELAIKLEADRMSNLITRQEEFQTEMRVVMEERRQRVDDNPRGVMMEQLSAAMYVAHPYRNPVVGWMNDLENLTLKDATDWYRDWYAPNNAALVIAGNVDPSEVIRLSEKYFGPIASRDIPVRKPQTEPDQIGNRAINVTAETTIPSQVMAFRVPKLIDVEKDWEPYALFLLAGVLDGHAAARLQKRLVLEDGIAHSVFVNYDGLKRGPGSLYVGFAPRKEHQLSELEGVWWEEIENLKLNGVTESELRMVKAQVIAGQVFSIDSVLGQAMRLGRMWSIGFSPDEANLINKKLRSISPEQVQQVAERYLIDGKITKAVLHPKKQMTNVEEGR